MVSGILGGEKRTVRGTCVKMAFNAKTAVEKGSEKDQS